MKNRIKLLSVIVAIMTLFSCDNLINDTENKPLNLEESAVAVESFIDFMTNGNPDQDNSGVADSERNRSPIQVKWDRSTIEISSSHEWPSIALENIGIDYSTKDGTWHIEAVIRFNNATSGDGVFLNGGIAVALDGRAGIVTDFNFSGEFLVSGEVNGLLNIGIAYSLQNCLNLECWSGSVNGYSLVDVISEI